MLVEIPCSAAQEHGHIGRTCSFEFAKCPDAPSCNHAGRDTLPHATKRPAGTAPQQAVWLAKKGGNATGSHAGRGTLLGCPEHGHIGRTYSFEFAKCSDAPLSPEQRCLGRPPGGGVPTRGAGAA